LKPQYTCDLWTKTHEIPVPAEHYWPFWEETLGHKKHLKVARGVGRWNRW